MIYIPDNQIPCPSFHADDLGFLFKWNGHMLRGIYPDSVPQARRYFESGFIEEIVEKKLFPKTWISEYENAQFGMILEHEMIEPVTYATEWNFQMLKDAALMVIDIAQIGLRYGYNMIDCHKLNVMFKNNRPLYVDIGSFIPQEKGCSGWKPYQSFLSSYYYILDLWSNGCSQLSQRMMAPHVELQEKDYWLFKRPLYRKFSFLLNIHLFINRGVLGIVLSNEKRFQGKKSHIKKLFNKLHLSGSQNLNRIRRRIKRRNLPNSEQPETLKIDWLYDFLGGNNSIETLVLINCNIVYSSNLGSLNIHRVLSIHSDEPTSRKEYINYHDNDYGFQSLCYNLYVPTFTHGKDPESRFCSDIVVIGGLKVNRLDKWSAHNTTIMLQKCEPYTQSGYMIIICNNVEELQEALPDHYSVVKHIPKKGILVKVLKERK